MSFLKFVCIFVSSASALSIILWPAVLLIAVMALGGPTTSTQELIGITVLFYPIPALLGYVGVMAAITDKSFNPSKAAVYTAVSALNPFILLLPFSVIFGFKYLVLGPS